MAILTVPKVLREKLGDEGVEALIALLNEAAHHERNNLLEIVEERFARRVAETEKRLDNRITEEVARLEQRISAVEAKFDSRIAEVEAKLDSRIAEVKVALGERYASLVRWMFIFWAGQIGVIVALFALLR
jgi:tetrahydromethanopterin S-methyltransferase subunit G